MADKAIIEPDAGLAIHVVEDNPPVQDAMRSTLKRKLKESRLEAGVQKWEYVWDLYVSPELNPGDIAICDLYPSGYWDKVPKPTLYPRSEPKGDDVENMMKACLDIARRYFWHLQHQKSVDVFVITFIPKFFISRGFVQEAETVRRALAEQDLAGVFEKEDQTANRYNYLAVIETAVARAKARMS